MKQIYKKAGFSLTEVMVGLSLFALLSAGIFASIIQYQKMVQTQYELTRAVELADSSFKELKSLSYSDMLDRFGIDSDETGSSALIRLGQVDGFEIEATATPNTLYGTKAGDAVDILLQVSWNRFQTQEEASREYRTTLIKGGIAQ